MHQDNHRKYKRTSMMSSAELIVPGDQSGIEALVDNVSYGGIGLYIPSQIAEGTDVIIRIIYNQGKGEKISETLSGTVRWCRLFGTWYGVGIGFKYLNPKEHGRLLNYLDQASRPKEECTGLKSEEGVVMDEETTVHPDLDHPYLVDGRSDAPCIKVYSGPLKGKEYSLTKEEYIIGRDPQSDIVMDEKVVSRRHARILKKLNEYMICDLDSVNGIYVNNLKLDKAVLQHGDMIQIGSCLFQFLWQRRRSNRVQS